MKEIGDIENFKSGDIVTVISDYGKKISGYEIVRKVPKNEIPEYFAKDLDDYWEVKRTRGIFKGSRSIVWGKKLIKED